MKKILLFSVVVLALSACKKEPGMVSGVVTYFQNETQGFKPDVGSTVYITTLPCDTISNYLNAAACKKTLVTNEYNLEDSKKTIAVYKGMGADHAAKVEELTRNINNLESLIASSRELLDLYVKNDSELTMLGERGNIMLYGIKYDTQTVKATVDGVGSYSVQLTPGDYTVIIISHGRSEQNIMEIAGRMLVKKITVTSKETATVDAKFDL